MSQRLSVRAGLLAAFAALLASGCEGGSMGQDSGGFSSVPAPLPAGSPRVLTEADAGTRVSVAVGETVAVTLVGVPTAGYVWEAESFPGFMSLGEALSGPTSEAQLQPGFTGGSHWEVLVFRVDAAGEGVLTLTQRRPWDANEPPTDTFEVTISAQ